eukprot:COSAG05_NODE_1282_length_5283_cov_4.584684_2_plen_128_part_00
MVSAVEQCDTLLRKRGAPPVHPRDSTWMPPACVWGIETIYAVVQTGVKPASGVRFIVRPGTGGGGGGGVGRSRIWSWTSSTAPSTAAATAAPAAAPPPLRRARKLTAARAATPALPTRRRTVPPRQA